MENKYNYFLVGVFILLFYLVYVIVKPVISAIFGSLLLAFTFYKMKYYTTKWIKNDMVSSFLTVIVMLLIIIIPSFVVINSLAKESVESYHKIFSEESIQELITKYSPSGQIGESVRVMINNLLFLIISSTSSVLLSIPSFALTIIITVSLAYYVLKESDALIDFFRKHLPFKESGKNLILNKLKLTTDALIFGTVLTAIIQGILGGIGFYIFGISSPVLWGFMMAAFSIIPLLGTGIIWAPAGIIQLAQGDTFSGVGILLFGALVVSTIDNIIRPKLIGDKANINPGVVLVGAVGGVAALGFIGLFIGPLALAIFLEILKFKEEFI